MKNKKNIKVLHVLPTLKKDGAEVQLSELFKAINNTEIDLFTFDLYKNGDSIIKNLNNIKVLNRRKLSFWYLFTVIRDNKYDIVHSHLPKSDLIVGSIKLFYSNFYHISSVHAQYGTRDGENKIKYFFSNIVWKFFLNKADGVIAISNRIQNWLIEEMGVNKSLIETIHYGIHIKDRTSEINNSRTIGMAARILPWKGWDKVLEVAYFLSKKNVDFKLKLAGSDDEGYLNTINSLIRKYELTEVVEVSDHYEDIDKFFSEINLFLFLSNSEGFGLVVLEAIENNVAVVCSDISPLNEFVKNSLDALVDRTKTEEVADLIKLYFQNNNELLHKVRKEQKAFIEENFTIDLSAKKVEKFYINTINV